MPRLSVIIPHRHDDQRLEATLLSVLENRPEDCEVIVVHDGSYTDPYALGDEVVFVDAEAHSSPVELLNAGVLAACSPVVNTLLDGVVVSNDWAEAALGELAADDAMTAVAMPIRSGRGQVSLGLDRGALSNAARLRSGRILRTRSSADCAGPELACGFFRRTVLLALDGFSTASGPEVAAVDMALALQALELGVLCLDVPCVTNHSPASHTDAEATRFAELAVEYGLISSGWLSAGKELLAMCLVRPRAALSWSLGVVGRRPASQRVRLAAEKLAARRQPATQQDWMPERRAA